MKILYIRNTCDIGAILVGEAARKNIKEGVINHTSSSYEMKKCLDFLFFCKNNLLYFDVNHFSYPYSTLLSRRKDIGSDIICMGKKEILAHKADGEIIFTPDLWQFVPGAEWIRFTYNICDIKKCVKSKRIRISAKTS